MRRIVDAPDDWTHDLQAAGLAIAVLIVLALLASVFPGLPQ